MARAFYSEINLHLVWHTKNSDPLLTPEVEPVVHRLLRHKACSVPGTLFHEVGGIENHVHLVLSVLPTARISNLVGQLKGYSAHEANALLGRGNKVLVWQTGYGVISFGTGDLAWVRRYVQRQKEHHRTGKTHDRLEQTVGTSEEALVVAQE
jgi:putative transposase